jgi:hypothetical protein
MEDDNETEFTKIRWQGEGCSHVDKWQIVMNSVMNRRVPHNAGNVLTV